MTKIDRLNKSYRNAKQKEEILLAKPSFLNAIKQLRLKWDIPTDGFDEQSPQDLSAWQVNQLNSYEADDEDLELELKRQKKYLKHTGTYVKNFESLLRKENLGLTMSRALINDIGQVLIANNLNPRWYSYVENYLFYNIPTKIPSGIEFRVDIDQLTGQEIILIKVTEEITKDDLTATWEYVRKYQQNLPNKTKGIIQPKKALERNRLAYDMSQKGTPLNIIADEINELFPKKENKKTYDKYYSYNEVYQMISTYRRIIKT
jgi:hypothetical protein